jgi:hypothetical protein
VQDLIIFNRSHCGEAICTAITLGDNGRLRGGAMVREVQMSKSGANRSSQFGEMGTRIKPFLAKGVPGLRGILDAEL